MQNIPPLEQVFNKGKDKNIAGLPYFNFVTTAQLAHVYCNIFPSKKN